VHKSKIKQISLAVCLAFLPLSGFAAGLGKLNVNSGLGEPLKAEVELLSVTPEELSTLTAAIASEEAYAVQGITRLGVHSNIKVDLAKNADGSPVLRLRSSLPISDPYLDMLIQVDWASGRLLREYTVLLDPPGYKESINQTSSSVVIPPSAQARSDSAASAGAASGTTTQAAKKSRKSKTPVSGAQDAEQSSSESGQLMTVKGDTLNSIAKELQVEGVSLDQMLVGLYENNKEAFSSGNMNRLKVGQIVKAPSKDTLAAIDPQQARQTIKLHSNNWNEYRSSLAGTVAEAPAAVETEQKQSASGKIATAEDKAAPVKPGAQDVVKLSAGAKDAATDSAAAKDFDAKILALQEEATAREKSLKESLNRTAALEKQIEDMQKLLALKNQTMTELQANATSAAKPAEQPAAAPVAEVKQPPKVSKPPVAVAPEPEPTFIESLFGDSNLPLIGGAAGITLLGAGWMYLRNKRRKDLDSFERGILTSGGLRANTVFGNTTGNSSTSDTSFLTDFAQSADGSMIDTNDVDPIAEAEVYMAYGRDAQAEEILKDAITKEPKRYELHLKLLEMYAGRKDMSAFETIAGELYTTLGTDDPVWAKVVELGATVEPDNPLYDTSKLGTAKLAAAASAPEGELDASDFDDVAVAAEEGLDFSLDDMSAVSSDSSADDASSAVMQSFASADNVEQDISFDLGTVDEAPEANVALGDDSTTSGGDQAPVLGQAETIDFGAALSSNEEANSSSLDVAADNSLEFDMSDFTSEPEVKQEQAETLPVIDFANAGEDQASALDFSVADNVAAENTEAADFNLEFNLPATNDSAEVEKQAEMTANANMLEGISFDLDAPAVSVAEQTEEISFELPVANAEEVKSDSADANEFDFSAINLDLGDAAQAVEEESSGDVTVELSAPAGSENQDVDIKLDLVAAYIDMDDKEGARELLDEVIKEGGPQQRAKAEQLLASLT